MNVLMSIKPEFADLILAGEKQFEFRKAVFRRKDIDRIFIYSSSPVKKIVASFEIGAIIRDLPVNLWEQFQESGGTSKEGFFNYFRGHDVGYAIKIEELEVFSKPIDPYLLRTDFRPPQSFCYLPDDYFAGNGCVLSSKLNKQAGFLLLEDNPGFGHLVHQRADMEQDFDDKTFDHYLALAGIDPLTGRLALLKELGCMSDEGKLTNAGVLFFAKDIDFLLNHAIVVCVLYRGTIKLDILDKKDFSSGLIENIENAILFVKRHTNVRYKIESIQREEVPDIPYEAIREAIINAVCHRDYFNRGCNVLVEVFQDRVVISNPGGLPADLPSREFGQKSVPRNPLIASLLSRINYMDKEGNGIDRIREAVARHGNCSVEFDFACIFCVTFRKGPGEENSQKPVEVIRNNPYVTRKELRKITGLSVKGVEWHLARLKEKEIMKRIGNVRGGRWEVVDGNDGKEV